MKEDFLVYDKCRAGYLVQDVEYDGGDFVFLYPAKMAKRLEHGEAISAEPEKRVGYGVTKHEHDDGNVYLLALSDNVVPHSSHVHINLRQPRPYRTK